MKRLILIAVAAATLATYAVPVFAQVPNVPGCDSVPKSLWAQCVIQRSQESGGGE